MNDVLDTELSWRRWRASYTSAPSSITWRLSTLILEGGRYLEFCDLIEEALRHNFQRFSQNKNIHVGQDEDEITIQLINSLKDMSFDATFERNVGGNCDISVIGPNDYLWLGEAKIYRSSGNALKGTRQLIDRYSTGLENQDRGAVIFYIKKPNALSIMQSWRNRLKAISPGSIFPQPAAQSIDFETQMKHAGSGRMLDIKHLAVVLFHSPTDVLATPPPGAAGPLGASR